MTEAPETMRTQSMAVNRTRLLLGTLFTSAVLCPCLYETPLEHTWMALRQSTVYRWSIFETLWTVSLYAGIEVWMTVVFLKHPGWRLRPRDATRVKPRGMRRPSRRLGEIVTYVLPLLAMDLSMIKKFADVPLADMLASGGYHDHVPQGSVGASLLGAFRPRPWTFLVPTFHNFSSSSPLQLVRALPAAAPSSRRLALELVASFIIYDFLFFLLHLALHTVPALRRWHAPHHAHNAQLHPQVTNQLSVPERLGLVLLANFSLNIIGAHVLTRTVFVPIFVWLLVEIHSGMDLPWAYDKFLPRSWGGGADKHMRHHRNGEGDFEPFFCLWDGLWEKWIGRTRDKRY